MKKKYAIAVVLTLQLIIMPGFARNSNANYDNSVLAKHIKPFANDNYTYDASSVSKGLQKMGMKKVEADFTGLVITGFNGGHSNGCPFKGNYSPDPEKGFAKSLHLGTTRIFKVDGQIDEKAWLAFKNFVSAGQDNLVDDCKYVTLSRLQAYLAYRANKDLPEKETGRHETLLDSALVQKAAAEQAWKLVFKLKAQGAVDHNGEQDPYISLSLVRLFFEDPAKFFASDAKRAASLYQASCGIIHA